MKRVGVIGGGQLAWMMADGAKKLGIELVVQTPNKSDPAVAIATETIIAAIDDAEATKVLAEDCEIVTFENEFVNITALSTLVEQGACFRPGLNVLSHILDKYEQRCYLQQIGLPVPKFIALEESNVGEHSYAPLQKFPVVLKARRHGYDGQGTFIIKDAETLQEKLSASRHPEKQSQYLLEEFIPFDRELAVIAARSVTGEIAIYPIVETQQQEQVCRRVFAPADLSAELVQDIEAIARTFLESLQAVGIFGIELFLTSEGKVLVNEIAPRTHNSGHFTLDACEVSQFEQHLRAICGLPLGNPTLRSAGALMVNLLGYETASGRDYLAQRQQIAQIPQAYLRWYGKTASRPGRKLGHVTVLLDDRNRHKAEAIAQQIESIWYSVISYQ
ncbi:MAG: N5-carboxyaminoimidazole ribonucleotide synthase [Chroococcidiopsis cubana SAG 39.79]|uniref:N5-carboxyaminoimidazole ribonucleotide synthase n=1 Tax=Chroococcidiopsis cubana SAG 39.79 TaxID=388085 RepID=A0AB37URA4_9CYAN|nr:5-(carboxyamino)imidazole ribonucleotide synthase [Chroococcidiopsis cubana]MDZ4874303.1 N5-carboxyaminoimidazole ribonucleotide synthase [Chroococcidiopsis cubana SAG 39.79]PSB60183.1 5-(carboxyamino)imidazole ribonucleotide synthase [Chroococcidiopsis cubana CCALA 043]RUT13897.1 N5-carboxyaminoimidazole ribonucleotide synthase [Chroococcidiopsis cubana SAG 39.79]